MKGAFTMPESDWCFLYHDKKYHFWFYADRIWEGQLYDVSIRHTSNGMFYRGGGVPAIEVIDLPVIKRNMEKYFQQRDFLTSSLPRTPADVFRSVRFDWDPYGLSSLI